MNDQHITSEFPAAPRTVTDPVPVVAEPVDPTRMHPSISNSWDLWSSVVGRTATTRLEAMQERFAEISGAVLSTVDGLHICSLGVDDEAAGRLAAMNSSLYGVARAESDVLSGQPLDAEDAAAKTTVSITTAGGTTALLAFIVPPFGQLLLAVSARDVALGTLMVQVRTTADDIADWLGQSAPEL